MTSSIMYIICYLPSEKPGEGFFGRRNGAHAILFSSHVIGKYMLRGKLDACVFTTPVWVVDNDELCRHARYRATLAEIL